MVNFSGSVNIPSSSIIPFSLDHMMSHDTHMTIRCTGTDLSRDQRLSLIWPTVWSPGRNLKNLTIAQKFTQIKIKKSFVSCYTYLEWSSPLKGQPLGSQTWSEKSENHEFNDQTLASGRGWVAAHLDGSEDNFGGKVGRDCSWSSLWGIFDSPPPGMSEIILHIERQRFLIYTCVILFQKSNVCLWSISQGTAVKREPNHFEQDSLSLLFSLPSYLTSISLLLDNFTGTTTTFCFK